MTSFNISIRLVDHVEMRCYSTESYTCNGRSTILLLLLLLLLSTLVGVYPRRTWRFKRATVKPPPPGVHLWKNIISPSNSSNVGQTRVVEDAIQFVADLVDRDGHGLTDTRDCATRNYIAKTNKDRGSQDATDTRYEILHGQRTSGQRLRFHAATRDNLLQCVDASWAGQSEGLVAPVCFCVFGGKPNGDGYRTRDASTVNSCWRLRVRDRQREIETGGWPLPPAMINI